MLEDSELVARFDRAGLPRRHLYPLWYRGLLRLGLARPPPILMSFAELTAWLAPITAVTFYVLILVTGWVSDDDRQHFAVMGFLALLNPLASWLKYGAIRRRLGLARDPS